MCTTYKFPIRPSTAIKKLSILNITNLPLEPSAKLFHQGKTIFLRGFSVFTLIYFSRRWKRTFRPSLSGQNSSEFPVPFNYWHLVLKSETDSDCLLPFWTELFSRVLWYTLLAHNSIAKHVKRTLSSDTTSCSGYFKIHIQFINSNIKCTSHLNSLASLFAFPF